MIIAAAQYVGREVLPRLGRIFLSSHAIGATIVLALTFLRGPKVPVASIRLLDLDLVFLAYAAIVFAFSTAGIALVLTFPNERFVSILVSSKIGNTNESAYADLLFVFSWTAVVHWLFLATGIITLIIRGAEKQLLNASDGLGYRLLVATLCALGFYCIGQFLLTMITLTQVGRIYEAKLVTDARSKKLERKEFIQKSIR